MRVFKTTQTFATDHKTQHIVIVTAKMYYSKGYKSKSAKGIGLWVKG